MEHSENEQRYNDEGGRKRIIHVINDKLARLLGINDAHNSIGLLSNIGLFKDKDTVMKGLMDIVNECRQEGNKNKKEWQSANRDSQSKNIQNLVERIMNICVNKRNLHHLQIERGDIIQECITSIYTGNPRPDYDEALCRHIASSIITYILQYNNTLPIARDQETCNTRYAIIEKGEGDGNLSDILSKNGTKKGNFPLFRTGKSIDDMATEGNYQDNLTMLRRVHNNESDSYEIDKTKKIIKDIIKEIVYRKLGPQNAQRNCLIVRHYYFGRNEKDNKPWTFDTLSEYITEINQGNEISGSRVQQITRKVEQSLTQKIRVMYSQ